MHAVLAALLDALARHLLEPVWEQREAALPRRLAVGSPSSREALAPVPPVTTQGRAREGLI